MDVHLRKTASLSAFLKTSLFGECFHFSKGLIQTFSLNHHYICLSFNNLKFLEYENLAQRISKTILYPKQLRNASTMWTENMPDSRNKLYLSYTNKAFLRYVVIS